MAQPHDPNDLNNGNFDPNEPLLGPEESLRTGAPVISAAPSRVFFVLGVAGAFIAIVLYFLIGHGKKEQVQKTQKVEIAKPTVTSVPPPLQQINVPPPPSVIPQNNVPKPPVAIPDTIIKESGPTDKQREQRIRSDMLIVNNSKILDKISGDKASDANAARDSFAGGDPNLSFANRAYASSAAEKTYAGNVGDLNNIIAQGKLIHGILETAINTQLPGTLRAIVSRDIYAEQGRNILVPKGSRLIGVYNTNIFRGQDRVFIAWTRVIRPDGVDIYVNSPGVDSLGRAGLEGYLDQKFREIFTGAILTSVISVGTAAGADAITGGNKVSTTTNTDGSSTSNGDSTSFAVINAVGQLSRVGKSVVDGLLDLRPTITVDQGTPINIFVNRDLHFPPGVANRAMIIE